MAPVERIAWLASFSLLISVAACSAPSESSAVGCDPKRPIDTGKSRVTLTTGGTDREFLLFVPSGYDGSQPHALMLVFHGAGPSADDRPRSEFEFDEIWNEPSFTLPEDMVIAAPRAAGNRWNTASSNSADIAFAGQILDHVEQQLCIDSGRIYASGNSSGGKLVSHLACSFSDRLTAVGTNIGVVDPFPHCDDQPSPLPIISVVGSEDTPLSVITDVHKAWAENNGCETEPHTDRSSSDVVTTEYQRCTDDATVVFHVVEGMGHHQARSSCANIPEPVRDSVCFEGDFDFRTAHVEFFNRFGNGA